MAGTLVLKSTTGIAESGAIPAGQNRLDLHCPPTDDDYRARSRGSSTTEPQPRGIRTEGLASEC